MLSMIMCTIQILDPFPRCPVLSPWHLCQLRLDIVRILMDSVLPPCSQQTQNNCTTFVQCGTDVSDVGPTLYKCYTKCYRNVFVFAGFVHYVMGPCAFLI